MRKLIATALAFVSLLSAADLSGRWTGRLYTAEEEHHGAIFVLKQNGSELTGTAGPGQDRQFPITNGKVDGDLVTFDVANPEGPIMHFKLTASEKRLAGDVHSEHQGETRDAKIEMTKAE